MNLTMGILIVGIILFSLIKYEYNQGYILFIVAGLYFLFRSYNLFNAIHRIEIINCERIFFYSVLNETIEIELNDFLGMRLECSKKNIIFSKRAEFLIRGKVLKSYCWFDDIFDFKRFLIENKIDAFITFKSA